MRIDTPVSVLNAFQIFADQIIVRCLKYRGSEAHNNWQSDQ